MCAASRCPRLPSHQGHLHSPVVTVRLCVDATAAFSPMETTKTNPVNQNRPLAPSSAPSPISWTPQIFTTTRRKIGTLLEPVCPKVKRRGPKRVSDDGQQQQQKADTRLPVPLLLWPGKGQRATRKKKTDETPSPHPWLRLSKQCWSLPCLVLLLLLLCCAAVTISPLPRRPSRCRRCTRMSSRRRSPGPLRRRRFWSTTRLRR